MSTRTVTALVQLICVIGVLGGSASVSATSAPAHPAPPRCPTAGDCGGYAAAAMIRVAPCPNGMCLALTLVGIGFPPGRTIGYRVPLTIVHAGGTELAVAYGTTASGTSPGLFTVDVGEVPCRPGERLVINGDQGYVTDLVSGAGAYLSSAAGSC